jgi:cytochrome d ubiquinol oxidase subunit I
VAQVFWSFRIMVGVGVLMLVASWTGLWVVFRRRQAPRWLLRGFAAMTFSGWIAVLAGWLTTEIGRQPWLVYGILTTAEAASKVPGGHIALTLAGYGLVYTLLLLSYIVVVTQLAIKEAAGESPPEPVNPAFTPGAA